MGIKGNDSSIAIQSSIALLQERFRQLQRVKEMREERELQSSRSMLSSSEPNNDIDNRSLNLDYRPPVATQLYEPAAHQPTGFSLHHHEYVFQPSDQCHVSHSLRLTEPSDLRRHCPVEAPLLMSLWSTETIPSSADSSTSSDDNSSSWVPAANEDDIDTSLHL